MVNTLNGPGSPSREEIFSQLEKIFASRAFQGAEILKSFLRFVVSKSIEGQESELKEYTIATEVFARKGDYDPRTDSLVRVQAARLRSKLEEYYLVEGKSDPIRIHLPKGHYVPLFTQTKTSGELSEGAPEKDGSVKLPVLKRPRRGIGTFRRRADQYLLAALIGLNLLLGFLAYRYHSLANRNGRISPDSNLGPLFSQQISPLWGEFVDSGVPVLIAYSNPAFQGNAVDGMKYWMPMELSPPNLRPPSVSRMTEPSSITDVYTGVGEVIAVNLLGNLFFKAGTSFRVERSLLLTWEDLKTQNIVFLGGPAENLLLRRLPQEQDFVHRSDPNKGGPPKVHVLNRKPLGNEQSIYEAILEGSSQSMVTRDYALISMLKGIEPNRRLLILAGITTFGTQACAEYISRPESIKELIKHLNLSTDPARPRLPDSYQVLLEVKIEGSIPVRTSYVTHHVLN